MKYMSRLGVWQVTDINEATAATERKPTSVSWVDIDKGDLLRSRLVVNETRRVGGHMNAGQVFRSTPPLETVRVLCSLVVSTGRPTQADDLEDVTLHRFFDNTSTPELPNATRGIRVLAT